MKKFATSRLMTFSLIALVGGAVWGLGRFGQAQVSLPAPEEDAPRRLDPEERSNVNLFRLAEPSVVNGCCDQPGKFRRSAAG